MLSLGKLVEYTGLVRHKVNPTGKFSRSSEIPIPHPNGTAVAVEYTFDALTDTDFSEYKPIIVFFNLGMVTKKDSDHPLWYPLFSDFNIYLEHPSFRRTPVQVTCQCRDFYYCWQYWNRRDGSLAGPTPPPYTRKTPLPAGSRYFDTKTQTWKKSRPRANFAQSAGLCKHLIRSARDLMDEGWLRI